MSRLSLVPQSETLDEEFIKFSYSMSSLSEISSGKYNYILKPWTSDDLGRCYSVSSAMYVKLLPRFANALAEFHKKSTINLQSWETFIGWWLASVLDLIVVRSWEIGSISEQLDSFELQKVNWNGFLPTSHQLFELYNDAQFNGWLMTAIYEANFDLKNVDHPDIRELIVPRIDGPLVDKFWDLVPDASEILVGESIGRLNCLKIMMESRKKTKIIRAKTIIKTQPNPDSRKKLLSILAPIDANDKFLLSVLMRLLPTSLLEDFNYFWDSASRMHPKNKCIIYSKSEAVHNDLFKFVAVFGRTVYGSVVIGQQHGGAYGTSRLHRSLEIESRSVDIWLSWGRFGYENSRRVRSKHLQNFSRNLRNANQGDILIVLNNYPRYTYWLYDCPQGSSVAKWFLFVQDFLKQVRLPKKTKALIRASPYCLGWRQKIFIEESISALSSLQMDAPRSIRDSIRASKLVITLSNGTTWLESIYANVPTIAILPDEWWQLNPNFSEIFEKLRRNGMLATNIDEISNFIDHFDFNRIDMWWNSDGVREARRDFLANFCNSECF
jgi:putative transferase (TIGR04331 family)